MALEAYEDFKKYKDSKKCRHYLSIIQTLKVIPNGYTDQNKLCEFYEFIPFEHRRGVCLDKVVQIVLQFYVGYFLAKEDELYKEYKKTKRKLYAAQYYAKNKEKIKSRERERYRTDPNFRDCHLQKNKKQWQKEKEFRKFLYADTRRKYQQKYYKKNKSAYQMYKKLWDIENREKINKQRRQKASNERYEKMMQRLAENELKNETKTTT